MQGKFHISPQSVTASSAYNPDQHPIGPLFTMIIESTFVADNDFGLSNGWLRHLPRIGHAPSNIYPKNRNQCAFPIPNCNIGLIEMTATY